MKYVGHFQMRNLGVSHMRNVKGVEMFPLRETRCKINILY